MTSISATSSSVYLSPLQKLQAELQAEVTSGAISSSDQGGAVLGADRHQFLAAEQAGERFSSAAPNPSPGDLKSKIDDLIAGEVSSGKLTSDQATELQGVFKSAFANGADGAIGPGSASAAHHGHHGHHGGPPPADGSSATDGTSSSSSATDILQQFLQSLQDSLSASSSSSYSATGASDPAQQSVIPGASDQLPDLTSSYPVEGRCSTTSILLAGQAEHTTLPLVLREH